MQPSRLIAAGDERMYSLNLGEHRVDGHSRRLPPPSDSEALLVRIVDGRSQFWFANAAGVWTASLQAIATPPPPPDLFGDSFERPLPEP